MHIKCPHCEKEYDIPEDRVRKFGAHVSFPCPSCKGKIEIDLKGNATAAEKKEEPKPAVRAKVAPEVPEGLLMGDDLKEMILKTVTELPPMPQVAQKARKITMDESSSFSDLAKVIETDQGIATRVLKISNSSYYGQAGKVTSLQQAAVVLGMKTLNELLTLACAGSLLGSELNGYKLDSGDLWMHSLATAGCARSIAKRKFPALADDAFSAGLIHDCGKLILDKYIFERLKYFEDFMNQGQQPFVAAEKEVLGFDHGQIAAEVCQKWQIPENLVQAIQFHHNPGEASGNELVNIIHAADSIALMSGVGAGIDGMMYEIDAKVIEHFGLDSNQISEYMSEAVEYADQTTSAQ